MPQLSIIVPVFNKVKYMDVCIQSILAQTVTDFELILVNDGSSDGSGDKCDEYKNIDTRVIVIHQKNQGVSAARNAGLRIAKGQYIGFVDSDDILDKDMYEILINNAVKYNADISMCGVKRIFPNKVQLFGGNNTVKVYNRAEGVSGLLNGEILLSNYDKIYKAETVKNIEFAPPLFEDTFYNFEALKNANKSVFDDVIKYNYMIRDNSHSMSPFGWKYMNTIALSKRMVHICSKDMPEHLDEAKVFDFNSNIFVLNLILLASKETYSKEYKQVVNNLKAYSGFFKKAKGIKARYKYGYSLFSLSPQMYSSVLRLYSVLTNSEHLQRKKSSSKQKIERKGLKAAPSKQLV